MDTPGLSLGPLYALAPLAVLAASGIAVGTPTTATNATSVATDQPFSGFTLGAAVVAVLAGGTYWYYRH